MDALQLHFSKHRTGAAVLTTKTTAPKKESDGKFSLEAWLARHRGGAMNLMKPADETD